MYFACVTQLWCAQKNGFLKYWSTAVEKKKWDGGKALEIVEMSGF